MAGKIKSRWKKQGMRLQKRGSLKGKKKDDSIGKHHGNMIVMNLI